MLLASTLQSEEMLSLRMFCEEWNDDKGHDLRRLAQHPSTNASDAV